MTKDDVRRIVQEHNVDIVRMGFTDVQGQLKGLNITVAELDRALDEGIAFDGSSIDGFARIEESDLVAIPDLKTFRLFPFDTGGLKSAIFICDVCKPDGTPLNSDPRQVLKRAIKRASDMGYDHVYVGPELEYFYFPDNKSAKPVDDVGYFDILPLDESAQAREETLAVLKGLGVEMEASHHEVAPSQHEIDYRYGGALKMADQVVLSKIIVKHIARKHGLYATFMPKPIQSENGSGMHIHQSLFKGEKNAFYSSTDTYNMSDTAKHYIAGLLLHAREITSVTNQTINSYKRLVPGYEAPAYTSWGRKNRSALVRVPSFKSGKENSCRVEYRAPDPAANPYLAIAVMVQAGLEGIEKKYALAEAVEENIFGMTSEEKESLNIDELPGDLNHATRLTEGSELVKKTLGEELFHKFIANKKVEWEQYRTQVTSWELETYLTRI